MIYVITLQGLTEKNKAPVKNIFITQPKMFCRRRICSLLCLFIICRDSYSKVNTNLHKFDEEEECNVNSGDFTTKTPAKSHLNHIFKEYAVGLSFRKDIVKMDRASGNDIHEIIFAVRQKNLDELKQILYDVSDIESANYGQYLTKKEIADLTYDVKPHVAILQYIKHIGATVVAESIHGEYVTAHAPVSVWETVFNTEFFTFHHSHKEGESPLKIVRAEKYFVPAELHAHVVSVFNTIPMPMAIWGAPIIERKSKVSNSSSIRGQVLTGYTTLALLNDIYKIDSNVGNSLSSQAAFETIGQYFNERDLNVFQTRNSIPNQPVTTKIGAHIDDMNTICSADYRTCMEANMDIQYLMAISQVSPTTHWYTDENSFAAWLLEVANYRDPPLVFSISFGAPESTVTFSEFEAFNLQAIKLGLMGITIVAASGGMFFNQSLLIRIDTRKVI